MGGIVLETGGAFPVQSPFSLPFVQLQLLPIALHIPQVGAGFQCSLSTQVDSLS